MKKIKLMGYCIADGSMCHDTCRFLEKKSEGYAMCMAFHGVYGKELKAAYSFVDGSPKFDGYFRCEECLDNEVRYGC